MFGLRAPLFKSCEIAPLSTFLFWGCLSTLRVALRDPLPSVPGWKQCCHWGGSSWCVCSSSPPPHPHFLSHSSPTFPELFSSERWHVCGCHPSVTSRSPIRATVNFRVLVSLPRMVWGCGMAGTHCSSRRDLPSFEAGNTPICLIWIPYFSSHFLSPTHHSSWKGKLRPRELAVQGPE